MVPHHLAVGKPRREVGVVEKPHPHTTRTALVENDFQVMEPTRTAEVLVGTSLDAQGTDAGILDASYFLAKGLLVLAVDPKERGDVILGLPGQHSLDSRSLVTHRRSSFFSASDKSKGPLITSS